MAGGRSLSLSLSDDDERDEIPGISSRRCMCVCVGIKNKTLGIYMYARRDRYLQYIRIYIGGLRVASKGPVGVCVCVSRIPVGAYNTLSHTHRHKSEALGPEVYNQRR